MSKKNLKTLIANLAVIFVLSACGGGGGGGSSSAPRPAEQPPPPPDANVVGVWTLISRDNISKTEVSFTESGRVTLRTVENFQDRPNSFIGEICLGAYTVTAQEVFATLKCKFGEEFVEQRLDFTVNSGVISADERSIQLDFTLSTIDGIDSVTSSSTLTKITDWRVTFPLDGTANGLYLNVDDLSISLLVINEGVLSPAIVDSNLTPLRGSRCQIDGSIVLDHTINGSTPGSTNAVSLLAYNTTLTVQNCDYSFGFFAPPLDMLISDGDQTNRTGVAHFGAGENTNVLLLYNPGNPNTNDDYNLSTMTFAQICSGGIATPLGELLIQDRLFDQFFCALYP